jgi:predicted phage-related endonuclease
VTARRVTPAATLVLPANAPHDQWLAARRWRDEVPGGYCIGSSDVPSILDLPDVDTPAHVWHDKVNALEKERNEAMDWGHVFEEPIAQEWCRRNRTVVRRIGLVSNVGRPWHQTTLDRRVMQCPLGIEGGCGLEVKNVGTFTYRTRWHSDLPDRILAQMAHQIFVTGFGHMHYAVNVGGNAMHQGVVYADREAKLIDYIVAEVDTFRERHLLTGVAPPWTAEEKVDKYLALDAQLHAERVGEIGIDGLDPVIEYASWAKRATRAENEKKRLKLALAQQAAGKQLITFAGQRAYSYEERSRVNVDLEALRERHPAAYADPEVVSETHYYQLSIDSSVRKMAEES